MVNTGVILVILKPVLNVLPNSGNMRNKREVFKIWGIILALSIGTMLAGYFWDKEGVLILRAITVIFFMYLFYRAKKIVDSFKPLIKDGYAEHLFNPIYLYTVLWMVIGGLTLAAIMDYFALPIWWLFIYMLGVIIIPFSSGVIKIRKNDNDWKH